MGLSLIEITMELEDAFGIDLSDSKVYNAQTVGGLRRLVFQQLKASDRLITACRPMEARRDQPSEAPMWIAKDAWKTLRTIIHRTGCVPLRRITSEARLTQDLMLG